MANVELHYLPFSAPCRSVQMVADVLGLPLKLTSVDLLQGEHLKPEYLKVNPHHTIPTVVDHSNGEFALYESRAILRYLVNQYSPNSPLYPVDVKKRALVDQALDFDGTTLYPCFGSVVYPVIKLGVPLNKDLAKMLDEKLVLLNDDLGKTPFVAGTELTIADLSLLATWTSIEAVGIWNVDHLKNIHAWVQRVKDSGKLKNYEELVVNTSQFYGNWIKEKLKGTAN